MRVVPTPPSASNSPAAAAPTDILATRTSIAEGAYTAAAVDALATKLNVEMPISSAVHRVLEGALTPADAITMLLERPVKAETG